MLVSYLVSNLMAVRCQIEEDQMQEITFYPSKAKYLLGLSASLLFTERGVSMAYDGEWMGHFVYLFFGLLSVVFVILLLPGLPDAKYLKLIDDEFEFRRLFRKHIVKWEDVENFEIWTFRNLPGSIKQLGWNYKEGVEVSKFVRINKMVGIDDTYGMKMEELLSLMNERLANHRDKHSRFR